MGCHEVSLAMWGVMRCHWPCGVSFAMWGVLSHYSVDQTARLSSGYCRQLLRDCNEITVMSCDLVHARCTKVLGVRIKVIRLSHTLYKHV